MSSIRSEVSGTAYRNSCGRRTKPGSKRGLVMLAGWTGTVDYWNTDSDGLTVLTGLTNYEREHGILTGTVAVDSTWGNQTIIDRITQLVDVNQLTGYWPTGKVHVYGNSMGSICAAKWALANPTRVASLGLSLFPPDLETLYDRNPLGTRTSLAAAYGGAKPVADDSPMSHTDEFAAMGIPINLWYSTTDTVTPLAETYVFGQLVGAAVTGVDMGAIGHAWGDFSVFNGAALADFIRSAP